VGTTDESNEDEADGRALEVLLDAAGRAGEVIELTLTAHAEEIEEEPDIDENEGKSLAVTGAVDGKLSVEIGGKAGKVGGAP
jgi:hypothetical protein